MGIVYLTEPNDTSHIPPVWESAHSGSSLAVVFTDAGSGLAFSLTRQMLPEWAPVPIPADIAGINVFSVIDQNFDMKTASYPLRV
jgi:hypothetical protein